MSISLISFKQATPANVLSTYLLSKGIQAKVHEALIDDTENNQERKIKVFQVLLEQQADLEQASSITQDFLKNPNDSKYQQAAWNTGKVIYSSSSMFGGLGFDPIKNWQQYLVTHCVGITCLVTFLLMYLGYSNEVFSALKIEYFEDLVSNHQWWRLIGPNFMHASFVHLVSNLLWWCLLASKLERTLGSSALIAFFIVSSLAANVAQLVYSGPNFLGMSGVVYALFGFMWLLGRLRPSWGLALPNGVIVFMLLWLILGYAKVLPVSMANEAHAFGLISGLLLALLLHQVTGSFSKPKS